MVHWHLPENQCQATEGRLIHYPLLPPKHKTLREMLPAKREWEEDNHAPTECEGET